MVYKNLLIYYKSLSKAEWKQFKKYISKYSNSKLLIKLILFLEKHDFTFNNTELHEYLYNTPTLNINNLRQLFNRLKIETNKFNAQHLNLNKTILLNEYYKNNQIDALLKNTNKILYRTADKSTDLSSDQIALEYYISLDTRKSNRGLENMEEISNKLDEHYLIEKLKIICAAYTSKNILQSNYQIKGIYYIEELITHFINNPLLQLWHQALLIVRDKNLDAYFKIKLFFNAKRNIDTEEKKQLITILINFCIANINIGMLDWFKELYEIYQLQIKQEAFYNQQKFMEYATYKNIITTALYQKEYVWTQKFLEHYKSKLHPSEREANYLYNKARILFAQSEYQKILPLLINFKSDDFFIEIANKVLLIKTFYEMDEYNTLSSTIDSFRIYLLRYKNKSYHYSLHMNFIKSLQQIIKKRLLKKEKLALINKIKNQTQIAEKTWLLKILK